MNAAATALTFPGAAGTMNTRSGDPVLCSPVWVAMDGHPERDEGMTGLSRAGEERIPSGRDDSWDIDAIDPRTGAMLSEEERHYRGRIRTEAERGFIAVDPLYHAHAPQIHEPRLNERGEFVEDGDWELRRRNKTMLRISFGNIGNGDLSVIEPGGQTLEDLGVTIARKAIGEVAADLM